MAPTIATSRDPQTVRGFWHGSTLGPYQLLCLRSFVDRGHRVEVFTYDPDLGVPQWAVRRNAAEIWSTKHVLRYQSSFGRGSFSLHSNLFRYALLHRLGGWWVDLDVVLLAAELPEAEFFFAHSGEGDIFGSSILKFPQGYPLLAEAVECSVACGEDATWGTTGPNLVTGLVRKHGLTQWCKPMKAAYPLRWFEVLDLFDPSRLGAVRDTCSGSSFVHLFNELWRGSGIPRQLGPPEGSYLDWLFAQHDFGFRFPARMELADVTRWIGNRNDRNRLESDVSIVKARCGELEARCGELEAHCNSIKHERDAILGSTSWRITAPLRALYRALRAAP
jgi:hypothetical protein